MVFEAGARWVAHKEFKAGMGTRGYLETVQVSKDPSIFTVLLEDTAAMLGLIVAFVGLLIGQWLEIPEMDGIASMMIGLTLAAAAILLAYETKGLLTGEGANLDLAGKLSAMVKDHAAVYRENELLTLLQGPQDILVTASLDFQSHLSADDG